MSKTTQNQNSGMNPQVRVYPVQGQHLKAVCSATLYGTIGISGIMVKDGQHGLFVQMPQQKDNKGTYHDQAFPVTKEAREELYSAIMNAYEQQMAQTQTQTQEQNM